MATEPRGRAAAGGRVRVDEVDFRILRERLVDGATLRSDRARVERVAARVGVHANTVATRLRKLQRGGVFLPLTMEPEPGRLGIAGGRVFLELPADRRGPEHLAALFLVEGVFLVMRHLDGWAVMLYAEDEATLDQRGALLQALTGARRMAWEARLARDFPRAEPAALTRLDARLLGALLRDARASLPALARQLGVAARTVERRHRRLVAEGVMNLVPGGAEHGVEGLALGYLAAEVPEAGAARRLAAAALSAHFPNHFLANPEPRGRVEFLLHAPGLAGLEAQAAAARRLPGVGAVTFRPLLAVHVNPRWHDWLARVLERRAA